ncbi:MAG: asparagine synthase (glutamine-hydrolyzing), partial [Candidatus Xenobia bacterium]
MCGIAGVARFTSPAGPSEAQAVRRMMASLIHRGPDDEGFYQGQHAVLGHRRLSIIDVSPAGRQPMASEDGQIQVVFNGEIYNHCALRAELELTRRFRSRCDTEVLVAGYAAWGLEGLLDRLEGMFAFAVLDVAERRLVLARDRLGIKPLYYAADAERLVFASEVRAVIGSGLVTRHPDPLAVARFLQLGSVPAPLTTEASVRALPAGHYLMLECEQTSLHRYWRLKPAEDPTVDLAELSGLFEETVQGHLMADVPVGVFLSGGIDSSALVAAASKKAKLTTLSLLFDEPPRSEATYARMVSNTFHTRHVERTLTRNDFAGGMPMALAAMDQPTVDGLNTWFICQVAQQHGLKVVLSGIGGDEVFWGYRSHRQAARMDAVEGLRVSMRGVFRSSFIEHWPGADRWQKLAWMQLAGPDAFYLTARGLFSPQRIQRLLGLSAP